MKKDITKGGHLKIHSTLWVILFTTFACGGDSGTTDFFDLVPSETAPNSAWNGDWSWEEIVSSSNCPGLTQGSTSHWTGHIDLTSEADCEKLINQDMTLPENTILEDFHCEWGGNALAIQWKLKTTSDVVSTCTGLSTINELLEIDESDSNKIEGTITGEFSISKTCPVEPGTPLTCKTVISATGNRVNHASGSLTKNLENLLIPMPSVF